MNLKIVKGNIVDAKVDAIVLPANSKLIEGSGASTAIFQAAGRKELTKECKIIGHCEVGSVVPTYAYNLSAKYIMHAVVPKWRGGNNGEYDLLSSAYASTLELSDVMECKSIAFPLLASGNNGFDSELAFEIAVKNIEAYEGKNLEEVILVVYSNRVEQLVKNLGYTVTILPVNMQRTEKELKRQEEKKRQFNDNKDAAQNFLKEQLQKGIDYFKDEEHREKAIKLGIEIVKIVMEMKKGSNNQSGKSTEK